MVGDRAETQGQRHQGGGTPVLAHPSTALWAGASARVHLASLYTGEPWTLQPRSQPAFGVLPGPRRSDCLEGAPGRRQNLGVLCLCQEAGWRIQAPRAAGWGAALGV